MHPELKEKLTAYYTRYYRDLCCLPDYKIRTENRLNEEEMDRERMRRIEKLFNLDLKNKKQFILGAGTGGLAVTLHRDYQSAVFGIEPNSEELSIVHLKCQEHGMDAVNFRQEFGENILDPDNTYDFVHCITVLEHVQNVSKCLDEMIRIVKPNGKIYINTPNYSYPYEGHYKINMPTFMPKFINYLWLAAKQKSWQFLRTINFLTEKEVNQILFEKRGISWQRVYLPLIKEGGMRGIILNYFKFKKGIYPGQEILITKL